MGGNGSGTQGAGTDATTAFDQSADYATIIKRVCKKYSKDQVKRRLVPFKEEVEGQLEQVFAEQGKLADLLYELRELTYLKSGHKSLVEGLSNYICTHALNQKMGELKKEFYARGELEAELKGVGTVTYEDFERHKQEVQALLRGTSEKSEELAQLRADYQQDLVLVQRRLEECPRPTEVAQLRKLLEAKADNSKVDEVRRYLTEVQGHRKGDARSLMLKVEGKLKDMEAYTHGKLRESHAQ